MRAPRSIRSAFVVAFLSSGRLLAQAPADDGLEFFETRVRPILEESCVKCHGAARQKSGLRLDAHAWILKGGERGPAVVPADPATSRLVQAVRYEDPDLAMPPKGRLDDDAIADLVRWVEIGAPGPDEAIEARAEAAFDLDARRSHWSWHPPRDVAAPPVEDERWARDPVDRFVLAGLEAAGLRPALPIDRRGLLRRLAFTVTGLPPTQGEIESFVGADGEDALARVVDRLLASPRFGERWGRHWLDLVRYAETRGHEYDFIVPNAWQYRDYVVRAFNADVPYDDFVVEHVAGDLLEEPRLHPERGFNESILGTGWWLLGEEVHSPVDPRKDELDRIANQIDVLSKSFLGLTVACARCHDHKFDAITTRDFYALSGFPLSTSYRQVRFETLEANRAVQDELARLERRRRGATSAAVGGALAAGAVGAAQHMLAARGGDGPWARELDAAREDPAHPLHVFACAGAAGGDPHRDDTAVIAATLATDPTDPTEQDEPGAAPRVVVDFAVDAPLIQDGFTFVRRVPGDLVLGPDRATRPRVVTVGAAEKDPAWDGLTVHPESEGDPSRIDWVQAGRTLRTPTFRIETSKLFYLVRGAGKAYAQVAHHRMNHPPLHHSMILDLGEGDGWRFVEHDVGKYVGLHAHVEFSPTDHREFAVARVEAGEVRPMLAPPHVSTVVAAALAARAESHSGCGGPSRPISSLQDPRRTGSTPAVLRHDLGRDDLASLRKHFHHGLLGGDGVGTLADLARATEGLLVDCARRLESDLLAAGDAARERAEIVDWMLARPELFGAAEAPVAYLAERAAVAAKIQTTSRLAPAILDGNGRDELVLIRGSHKSPGDVAPRGFLEAIDGRTLLDLGGGSGRLALARRIVDPSHAFAARVWVNRVWKQVFGRGIVSSVDDFGVMGEPPTHPELLDRLTLDFIASGWSTKRLIRRLLLTSTFGMSSRPANDALAIDPSNQRFHHVPMRRLEGETIRDAILAVSGRLDDRLFGKSVPIHLTDFLQGRGRPRDSGPLDGDGRRSIYLSVRRNFLVPLFTVFDFPSPATTVGRRTESNVPAQALALENDPFVLEQSARWARAALEGPCRSARDRVGALFEAAFARPATEDELRAADEFLAQQRAGHDGDELAAWTDLCHTLFNVKEFVYVP